MVLPSDSMKHAPGCPDAQTIASAAVAGVALAHCRDCPGCAAILAEFQGLEHALTALRENVFDAASPSTGPPAAGSIRLFAAAAALLLAAMVGVAGLTERVSMGPRAWRGDMRTLTVEAEWLPGRRLRLVWPPTPGAATYVVSLLDVQGRELLRAEVPAGCSCDWSTALPDSGPSGAILWTVDAVTAEAVRLAAAAGVVEEEREP